jgi:hypothetical protein
VRPIVQDTDTAQFWSLMQRIERLERGVNGAYGSFSVYRNAALSLSTNAVVTFDAEEWDYPGWYNTSNGRWTPTEAGIYRLNAALQMNGTASSVNPMVRKNGAVIKQGTAYLKADFSNPIGIVSALVQANGSTDYFEISISHNGSGSQALTVGAASCYFQGEMVGRI